MIDEIFNIFSAVMPVANFSVMHKSPVFPNKRVAIASIDRSSCCGANMGEKQTGLNMRRKRAQIAVIPSRQDIFKLSGSSAFVIPSNTKPVTIGDPCRLSRCCNDPSFSAQVKLLI
jgi:hypothetical protein